MAKTVNLIHPDTGATIAGTITDEEYETYIAEGFEPVVEETPVVDEPVEGEQP